MVVILICLFTFQLLYIKTLRLDGSNNSIGWTLQQLEKLLRDYCGSPETYLNHPVHDVDIEPGSVEANDEECVGVLGDEVDYNTHHMPFL